MNLRVCLITEIPQKEEITVVMVFVGGVPLMQCYTIYIIVVTMHKYLNLVKCYVNMFIIVKDDFKVFQILILVLLN